MQPSREDQKRAGSFAMSSVQFNAGSVRAAPALLQSAERAQAPMAFEIAPTSPFSFSYTKVRLDTGEAVWRWPQRPPNAVGDLVDIST
jgi:hypothetical protein